MSRIFRADDWLVEKGVDCVVCPGCSFTFDRLHTNDDGSIYTCPACEASTDDLDWDRSPGIRGA